MKIMILMFHLLIGTQEPMKLIIDVNVPVESCQVYNIKNDRLYRVDDPYVEGSKITLFLKSYHDYEIVINGNDIISITPDAYEIVDERDLSISSDWEYEFRQGVLVFENSKLTSK
jgi:hypothetical protein